MIEERYDIVSLPSGGKYYKNGAKKVKMTYLNGYDESILTSPQLLKSGNMVDELLRRKIQPAGIQEPYVDVDNMLIGDRFALIMMLRATFQPIYKLQIPYRNKNNELEYFIHEVDLRTIQVKDILVDIPYDEKTKTFSYTLPESGHLIRFRLMTGMDEKAIRSEQTESNLKELNTYKYLKLARLITAIDQEEEPTEADIKNFLAKIPLVDFRKLNEIVSEVMPSLDMTITVKPPVGEVYTTFLRFDNEFWFPTP